MPEFVVGQLAAMVGAGPKAEVVTVSASALPVDGSLARFQGVGVGSIDIPEAMNFSELRELVGHDAFNGSFVNAASRARVVVFQTWVNATDEQVVVRLDDGMVFSIDHGDCFRTLEPGAPTRIVVAEIPGISGDVGREWKHMMPAVEAIQALSDEDILGVVAGLRDEANWQAPFERRLAVARWLIKRRDRLGEELVKWAPRLS
jgi:hypothetical protein